MVGTNMLGAIGGGGFWMPTAASEYANHVDALFQFILWLSTFFFVLLMVLTARWAWKYRKSPTNTRSSAMSHNFKLEFLWSAIPTVLLVVIFAWGFNDFTALSAAPADSLQLRVVGRQWSWSVAYPTLDRECTPEPIAAGGSHVEFVVPVDQPFTVQLSSEDVLHSFWVPAFRVKRDALPNRYTGYTVTPNKVGDYAVYCAEYCGNDHSQMRGTVRVLSQADWEAWKKGDQCKLDPKAPDYKPKLFAKNCGSCHGIKAEQGVIVGPNLFGKFGKPENTSAGPVTIDDAYIRESIEYPEKKIVDGFAGKANMPSFRGRLKEAELAALIDFIKSLQ